MLFLNFYFFWFFFYAKVIIKWNLRRSDQFEWTPEETLSDWIGLYVTSSIAEICWHHHHFHHQSSSWRIFCSPSSSTTMEDCTIMAEVKNWCSTSFVLENSQDPGSDTEPSLLNSSKWKCLDEPAVRIRQIK